ncbi:MAG: glycoside hydrolase family 73 protein [Ruminococcus sp.]|jgi:flagellum-specific peptidoglycan hydrolase FlgJ
MKKKQITACLLAGTLLLQSPAVLYAAPEETNIQQETSRSAERQKAREASSEKGQETLASVPEITNAAEVISLSERERVEIIGRMCQQDYAKSGILASVSAAQCILESGYMGTDLAQEANNCFGMKATLSENDWENSTWDGVSTYTKQTGEEYNGQQVTVTAAFRKYDSVADSVADHSAYLLGATDGDGLRYPGLKGETDYRKAIQIIKDGGYATDSNYVSKICNIIERFDLTQYDTGVETKSNDELLKDVRFYRIRKSWEDEDSQLGAFLDLDLAKKNCKKGYTVYDWNGEAVYEK